jgi:hypothetical protein
MHYLILLPIIIASLSPYAPRAGDETMIRQSVIIEYNDGYRVSGWLRTPCNELRIDGDEVYSVYPPDVNCMQTLEYFAVEK